MPRTVHVSIWGWLGLGISLPDIGIDWGSVGHCMLWDPAENESLLSQFPHPCAPGQRTDAHGPNTRYSMIQTRDTEKRDPSVVFRLEITDEHLLDFNRAVNIMRDVPFWDWDPMPPLQTHCARSVYDALVAGGVNVDPTQSFVSKPGDRRQILPNMLWYLLQKNCTAPEYQAEKNSDLKTIEDNSLLVTMA